MPRLDQLFDIGSGQLVAGLVQNDAGLLVDDIDGEILADQLGSEVTTIVLEPPSCSFLIVRGVILVSASATTWPVSASIRSVSIFWPFH